MPEQTNPIVVESTIFDLAAFEEVQVGKVIEYVPVTTIDEALAKLGNDSNKLLAVVNDGLLEEAKKNARKDPSGWHTFDDDDKLNGPFDGQPADMKKVNSLVLTLAKTVFGFSKDLTKDQKRESKESAKSLIQGNEAMRAGLQKSAAIGAPAAE